MPVNVPEHSSCTYPVQLLGTRLTFRDFFREYLEQKGIERFNDDEMIARFHQIMYRISLRFFKKPFEKAK
jgi:aspartate/glutamate racemase